MKNIEKKMFLKKSEYSPITVLSLLIKNMSINLIFGQIPSSINTSLHQPNNQNNQNKSGLLFFWNLFWVLWIMATDYNGY